MVTGISVESLHKARDLITAVISNNSCDTTTRVGIIKLSINIQFYEGESRRMSFDVKWFVP